MESAREGWNKHKDERNGCKYTVVSALLFDTNVCLPRVTEPGNQRIMSICDLCIKCFG